MTPQYIIDQQASMAEFEFSEELKKQQIRVNDYPISSININLDFSNMSKTESPKENDSSYWDTENLIGSDRERKDSPVYGEWQLCPLCEGSGESKYYAAETGSTVYNNVCSICEGKKMIAKTIIG